jgi:DNA-binding beta-propeller fold protein YncE
MMGRDTTMKTITRKRGLALLAGLLLAGTGAMAASAPVQAPSFEVDPFWPKPLPNHWVLGSSVGVWVDKQDHVWMVHRANNPETIRGQEVGFSEVCCKNAPRVLEFDPAGNLVQAWGPGPTWMESEHGITVDEKGNVWLPGGGGGDSQILKYSRDGKFLQQIGKKDARVRKNGPDESAQGRDVAGTTRKIADPNSLDMESFGRPTKVWVDEAANEAYVSDGYVNHRLVVLDRDTGKFKRIWGAYGNKPDDTLPPGQADPKRGGPNASQPSDRGPPHDPNGKPLQQFRNPVHCVGISKDGLVYVCDRQADRLQVFTKDGKFVKETHILNRTMNAGSVWDVAFSADPNQTFIYVADGENSLIHILKRDTLEELTAFGDGGRQPGQWHGVHNIATDSKGNIYTTETYDGKRIQKFVFKGLKPVTTKYQGAPWPVGKK